MEKTNKKQSEIIELGVPKDNGVIEVGVVDAKLIANRLNAINQVATTLKELLVPKIDYGIIPGMGNKPCLFKSGAEKVVLLYSLFPKYNEKIEYTKDVNGNTIEISVHYTCSLTTNNGLEVAQGIGKVSTLEKKFRYENPMALLNNICKMAKKRSLVDAALSIGNLSQVFTQDIEEMSVGNAKPELSRNDKMALYPQAYKVFERQMDPRGSTEEKREKLKKEILPGHFENAGIERKSFMEFNFDDRSAGLKYLEDFTKPATPVKPEIDKELFND